MISFISLLNSFTSSFSIFNSSSVLNTAVESLCSTILYYLLFFLISAKFSFDFHIALCYNSSLAVFSSIIIITILASNLIIITVAVCIYLIFTVFRALLIVFLYIIKLTVMTFIFIINSSYLSLYTLCIIAFNFCFMTFAVTFIQLKFCVSAFIAICAQIFNAVLSAF